MAASLSNPSLSTPRFSASLTAKPLKTLPFRFESFCKPQFLCRPTLGLSLAVPLLPNSRRVFDSYSSVKNSAHNTNEGKEEGQDGAKTPEIEAEGQDGAKTPEIEANLKPLPRMEILIKVYKEGVLTGDEKTMSDVEATIHRIECEKNEFVQKISNLSAELASGKEKYIRLQADFDNFRKRSEKERLTTRSDAQGEVIETLLLMVDGFERAKQQIRPETEKERKIDTSYQGIYKQFVEIMRSLHVSAIPTVGKPFDPSLHEAIARDESKEYKEGIVIQEFRRGFILGDRLLRPAKVKVSSGPGKKTAPPPPQKSAEQPTATAGIEEH
ncbi:hypothetical protein Nepgr_023663 [Nepenthes gracilis]|uniref:GrpE protein homolog n=1 Tax=Nepenthes gracilis TaxID=150966 RepID=A0AAD3T2V5_NEPGR|nr:hypothetical protein Nepgr_023663 [Nepenthes gracilis]